MPRPPKEDPSCTASGTDLIDRQQHEAAVLIALRTGLLKKCPVHDEVYDPGQHDYQGACMVASFLVNCDAPLVAPFAGNRAPLTERLKAICGAYRVQCPRCEAAGGG